MKNFVLKTVTTDYIYNELEKIGFDSGYRHTAVEKFNYENIKIYSLNPAQANILKQTALTVGAECATHHDVITGTIEKSDVILTGSRSQFKKISQKLINQPFGLKVLGEEIINFLDKRVRTTKIAGILNITPDSFSDGGEYFNSEDSIRHFVDMVEDGADLIDIGAESTRPNALPVSDNEQIRRLKTVLDFLQKEKYEIPVSVDTRSSVVADFALNNGASLINDVSGFDFDEKMPKVIAQYNASVIIQHSQGTPENMQKKPQYGNLIDEIFFSLKNKAEYAESLGIKNIIIDPGIGFGKTRDDNFEILNRIEEFYALDLPIMVGVSRKSLLGINDADNETKDALTLAISYPLYQKGIDYLRVHNVKLHKTMLKNT